MSNHCFRESTDAAAPVIIIPAYQPSPRLVGMVEQLLADPEQILIVVDDGSGPAYADVFSALADKPRLHLLRHAVNLGKGQALKTGFNYVLISLPENLVGVVTADADGQHLVDDVRKVASALADNPGELVLGRRLLRGTVPWKSAIGNRLTKHIFSGLVGRNVEDTQTGLRGIPRAFLRDLLPISATGYEFELEMLVRAVEQKLRIREVEIKTIYEDDNTGSHFNPIRDSFRIYFVFLRFVVLALTTAALDLTVFVTAYRTSSNILLSTAAARVVAGLFNFHFARTAVFKSSGPPAREFLKYVGLVVWLMTLSYGILTGLVIFLGLNVYLSKLIAETTLFLANFAVQRLLIFGRREAEGPRSASTDWDAYYTRPLRQARVTRQITARLLLNLMKRYAPPGMRAICELGGANSCFYVPMRTAFAHVEYSVIDNNTLGLELLKNRWPGDPLLKTRNADVLQLDDQVVQADIVYSVGLIEHFPPAGTARAIQKHFSCVRPGGLVIITFPTPTWLYRGTRYLAEQLGVWEFPDERPLRFDEVEEQVRKYGTVVESRINWPIVLTQGIVIVKAC